MTMDNVLKEHKFDPIKGIGNRSLNRLSIVLSTIFQMLIAFSMMPHLKAFLLFMILRLEMNGQIIESGFLLRIHTRML